MLRLHGLDTLDCALDGLQTFAVASSALAFHLLKHCQEDPHCKAVGNTQSQPVRPEVCESDPEHYLS